MFYLLNFQTSAVAVEKQYETYSVHNPAVRQNFGPNKTRIIICKKERTWKINYVRNICQQVDPCYIGFTFYKNH